MAHFLAPAHARCDVDSDQWHADAVIETPGADARGRLFLRVDDQGRLTAAFAAYGPPVVIAVLDGLCARVSGQTVASAQSLMPNDIEQAFCLSATQRYAAVMAIDVLAKALSNLGR
ncbi:iron-sulfur cluster assembly scaffold protein [Salinisphaera sp. Q1T1-3]|uniref:iron-sulfur cluster assembly scaffold protein n=1 Tax=Salinisphaera sp. Q1T1-3 TaxID=2321229 RepID=UPI001314E1A6|nr:iron-sulfur cluster assembly scaffold protein [Salinisphaera sp. Q1T1-3]